MISLIYRVRRLLSNQQTLVLFAHHCESDVLKTPRSKQFFYRRTMRTESSKKPFTSSNYKKNDFLAIRPPKHLQYPSLAFSDSLSYFNLTKICHRRFSYVGIFQYRRILCLWSQDTDPIIEFDKTHLDELFNSLENFTFDHQQEIIYVANPIHVSSLEAQYSESQPQTLDLFCHFRNRFRRILEMNGYDTLGIDPEVFYWSSLYFGPRDLLIPFQDMLLEAFEVPSEREVPKGLSDYESRWVGFVTERLFSDYIQCLIASNSRQVRTVPVLLLN